MLDGKPVRLSDSKGRYTLLSFNRFAACPMCNLAVREFSRKAPEYAARNLRVISFFESSDENFSQLTGDASGTGLGLAISRQVVEAMLWRRRPSWRNW